MRDDDGRVQVLNEEQRLLLTTLAEYTEAPTTRRLADKLHTTPTSWWNYDVVQSKLVRLEKRGLVQRDKRRPAHWVVTPAGKNVLGLGI